MIVYEWRKKTRRYGPPELHPKDTDGYNFHSTYGYPESTADIIREQGNTRNLKGKAVYSDTLYIDVDKDDHVDSVRSRLEELSVPFAEFNTGNRGRHFHIGIVPTEGTNVIYSQIQWLKDNDLWGLIDQTIYKETGQFRAIGAIHQKTGKVKELVDLHYVDKLLAIPMLTPPPVIVPDTPVDDGDAESRKNYFMNLMAVRDEGGRHGHMYILWRSGLSAGFDRETIKDSIRRWNEQQPNPHTNYMVEQKLKGFR